MPAARNVALMEILPCGLAFVSNAYYSVELALINLVRSCSRARRWWWRTTCLTYVYMTCMRAGAVPLGWACDVRGTVHIFSLVR